MTEYPNLYIVFYLLNGAWNNRTIISGSTCSITDSGSLSYCINPAYSGTDVNQSHFVFVNGVNNIYGIASRISIGVEDALLTSSTDYSDVKFAVASTFLDSNVTNDMYASIPICYVKGTRILCFVDGIEKEILIEEITTDTLVKTYGGEYKKVVCVTKSSFMNSRNKMHNRVYQLKGTDLFVSGGHSIMVDELKECEKIYGVRKIHDKYCLVSCLSDLFEAMNDENRYYIYHISVGNADIVYANGILSETFDLDWYVINRKREERRGNKTIPQNV